MNITDVCDGSNDAQSGQVLAWVAWASFSVYVLLAIGLSATAIHMASHPLPSEPPPPCT